MFAMEQQQNKSNGHVSNGKEKLTENGRRLLKKVYITRNSVLTDLMDVNHLQTVYNISVAIFNLLLINSVIYYIAAPQKFWRDIEIVRWAASNVQFFILMWICLNAFAWLVYAGFKSWIRVRNRINTKVADFSFLLLYSCSILLLFIGTPYLIFKQPFRPITNFAIMCEQVRIFMKTYSFVKENVSRALQYKPSKDGDQDKILCPSANHYLYFLFIPAFIYNDSYPRTKTVNKSFIYHNAFKFIACIIITYCLFMRFIVDIFENIGVRQFTMSDAALTLAGSMAVGSIMMFLMFYGLLHSWLNIFAELLRFADREFYQDWWNSTSFSEYYRKWNAVVYEWIYAYIYQESYKLGFNRTVSLTSTLVFSAVIHEYIIAVAMGFCFPVLMIVYSTIGVLLLFFTQKRTGHGWNTFFWSMLFSGWGCVFWLYSVEWYARANCKRTTDPLTDFFKPMIFESTCNIIDIDA